MDPRFEIPKRKYFSTVEIPKLYEVTKSKALVWLKSAKHVSVTTDMWTSVANDDYMALTCRFMDEQFQWHHLCLEVIPFPEIHHTGDAISSVLTDVLRDWEILKQNHVVVRDNGKNVVAAMYIGKFNGIPCLAHTTGGC